MPRSDDAALEALSAAAFTYHELYGLKATIAWHEHELTRLKVNRDIVERRRAEGGLPPQDDQLRVALEALDFYGNPEHYRTTKRKPVCDVMRDSGGRAGAALAEIEGPQNGGDPTDD